MVDDLSGNGNADCAVVFAYVDANNYSYFSLSAGNEGPGATGLFKIVNGERQEVAFKGRAIQDNEWHQVELNRVGNRVKASIDDQLLVSGEDEAFGTPGPVGIGSYNDQAWFDDIEVVQK